MKEKALIRFLLCCIWLLLGCLILSGSAAFSKEEGEGAESQLNGALAELLNQYNLAYEADDFQKRRDVMRQVLDLTKGNDSESLIITAMEARMILKELESALAMPRESFQIAKEAQIEQRLGRVASLQGDYDSAIAHLNKSLEMSKVYGDVSFNSLETKMLIAGVIENSGKDIGRGISCANEVKAELERRNMTDCQLYQKTLTYLFILQLANGEHSSGIATGETLIRLMQKQGTVKTLQFAIVTGIVAEYLNITKQHEKAYVYSVLGLKTCPAVIGIDIKHGLRLLHECAKAAVALNKYEQVPLMYEKMLSLTAATPGYPDEYRAIFMEEYSAILQTMGDQKRNGEIKQEIEKIRNPAPPQKSRYSD